MRKKVCIIIPVYNRESLLLRTLDAVLKQTMQPARLILCDDGSTDDTVKNYQNWVKEKNPIFETTVLDLPHLGAAAARNAGLKSLLQAGDCDLVCFLDSDDMIPMTFLEHCEQSLRQDPRLAGVCVPRVEVNDDRSVFSKLTELADDPILWMMQDGAGFLSCSVLCLRKVAAVGGFDEKYSTGHDMFFFSRLLQGVQMKVLEGRAVIMERRTTQSGDAPNLSGIIPDRYVIWSKIREEIAKENQLFYSPYTKVIHDLWYKACKKAQKERKIILAMRCCIKSMIYCHACWRPYIRFILLVMLLPLYLLRVGRLKSAVKNET